MQKSQTNSYEEVIAAVASAAGAAARGIIRISGLETQKLLENFLSEAKPVPNLHSVSARQYDIEFPMGETGARLPMQILLWPTNRSYTGQPAAEIHTIGSPPILEAMLDRLYTLGAKPAAAGEFTLRSFLSGRMNLVQAEAVLGVIDAHSDRELDVALTQLAGGISPRMRTMRDQLLNDLADLEAGLDFVEEDIDFVNRTEFQNRLKRLLAELESLCEAAQNRMLNRTQKKVVLAGLANAGKSTLFNLLTAGNAIVSEIEGTTTDYLTGSVNWEGIEITFHDTAGWEFEVSGEIAEAAQHFREAEYQQADLIVWCTAANLTDEEFESDQSLFHQLCEQNKPVVRLLTKSDTGALENSVETEKPVFGATISIVKEDNVETEKGIADFRDQLISRLIESEKDTELLSSTAARCKDSLQRAQAHSQAAFDLAKAKLGDELIAEEIRSVLQELGLILGHVYTDDLLDRIFSNFCIGK